MPEERNRRLVKRRQPSPPTTATLLICVLFISLLCSAQARRRRSTEQTVAEVVWSSSSTLFRNVSLFADGGGTSAPRSPPSIEVLYGQSVEFACPEGEWLVVSAVSEMSLIECQLDSASTPFFICDGKNMEKTSKKLIFRRQLSAEKEEQSGGAKPVLYHQPGTSHYFISTSNGSREGLWNSRGGLCASANLRLRIEFGELEIGKQGGKKSMTTTTAAGEGLQYSIEEMPLPMELPQKGEKATKTEQDSEATEPLTSEMDEKERHNRLAKALRIKPEFVEFVRNHAINGGTGEIRFPPTEEDERDERMKWPRFVSTNDPWRRSKPQTPLFPPPWPVHSSKEVPMKSEEMHGADNSHQSERDQRNEKVNQQKKEGAEISIEEQPWTSSSVPKGGTRNSTWLFSITASVLIQSFLFIFSFRISLSHCCFQYSNSFVL